MYSVCKSQICQIPPLPFPRYLCGSTQRNIALLAIIVFLCVWFWSHRPTVVYYSTSDSEETAGSDQFSHSVVLLRKYSQDDPLVHLLGNLTFKNYGVVKRSDQFRSRRIRCQYLEAENVTEPYRSWAGECSYLYHYVSGDWIPPPSGMRSSVPLGGKEAELDG